MGSNSLGNCLTHKILRHGLIRYLTVNTATVLTDTDKSETAALAYDHTY